MSAETDMEEARRIAEEHQSHHGRTPIYAQKLARAYLALAAERDAMAVLLREAERTAKQAISEYDALGPNGPHMPSIDTWLREFVAEVKARALLEEEKKT